MSAHLSISSLRERVALVVKAVAAEHAILVSFEPHDPLVDGGMTSVAMIDLMLAIEGEFELTIPDSELNAANFFCIVSLEALVERLCLTNDHVRMAHEDELWID